MKKYSDQAKEIQLLKDSENLSVQEVSKRLNIERSKVSRLLKLLTYSVEIINSVDKGDLPLSMPNKAKKKPIKIISEFTDNQENLIQICFNKKHITFEQLKSLTNLKNWKLREDLRLLVDLSFLKIEEDIKPFVYSIASKGASRLGEDIPKRWVSSSVIHQHVLKNQIEINITKVNKTMKFIPRLKCWESGLYPSHGEYFFQYEKKDGKFQMGLILIDDYIMPSLRINRSYTRSHKPPSSSYSGPLIHAVDLVDVIIIYCTDEKRTEKHKVYFSKYCRDINIPVDFRYINSFWSVC